MSSEIVFNDYISSVKVDHRPDITKQWDAWTVFVESDANVLTYTDNHKFHLFNVDVLQQDQLGNYFFTFSPHLQDIASDFLLQSSNKNVEMWFMINGIDYKVEDVRQFLKCCAPYCGFQIKFVFSEKPSFDDTIDLTYKSSLLKLNNVNKLRDSIVITDALHYKEGVCYMPNKQNTL
jgi:hypothetical protein